MNYFLNLTEEEFLSKFEEFKRINSVSDMTIQQFKEVLRQEKEAVDAAEERESLEDLHGSTSEEYNAKCNICASGLSIIEAMLYGNRCIFCTDIVFGWKFLNYFLNCYYDWLIYHAKLKLIKRISTKDAWGYFTACLGNMGYTDINTVKSIKEKKKLLKELNARLQ